MKPNCYQKIIICVWSRAALFFVYCAAIFAPPGEALFGYSSAFWNGGEVLFISYSSVEYVRFVLKIALTWKEFS